MYTPNLKITFCVTCYDGDIHLLQDRLLGIYAEQTVQPDEVLVIASGTSSDPIIWDAPDLTIKSFEKRKLPGGARNQGGKFATGDVIVFCDVDDPIHPQKCEVVKKIFEDNKDVDALIHNFNWDTGDLETLYDLEDIKIEKIVDVDRRWEEEQNYVFDPYKDIPRTCVIIPSEMAAHHGHISCKKEIFDSIQYREDMWLGEDGDFCQSIVKSNYKLYYTPVILINYITT